MSRRGVGICVVHAPPGGDPARAASGHGRGVDRQGGDRGAGGHGRHVPSAPAHPPGGGPRGRPLPVLVAAARGRPAARRASSASAARRRSRTDRGGDVRTVPGLGGASRNRTTGSAIRDDRGIPPLRPARHHGSHDRSRDRRRSSLAVPVLLLIVGLLAPAAAAAATDSDGDTLPNSWELSSLADQPLPGRHRRRRPARSQRGLRPRRPAQHPGVPRGHAPAPRRQRPRRPLRRPRGHRRRRPADLLRVPGLDLATACRQRRRRHPRRRRESRPRRPGQHPRAASGDQPQGRRHRQRRLVRRCRMAGRHRRAQGLQPPVVGQPHATSATATAASAATRRPGPAPTVPGAPSCPVFPATNVWNTRIDGRPVASNSSTLIATIGLDRGLHMDFGSYAGYGIPYQVVTAATPRSTVTFDYDEDSDHVGYPIPASPLIEGGSDRHILLVDRDACRLYELFDASPRGRRVAGRQRRDLGPALQRAAHRRLDQRGCGRPADPARAGALRRGRRRRDRPRAAVHDQRDAEGLHLPGPAPRQLVDVGVAAADGHCASASRRPSTRAGCRRRLGSSPRRSSATA